MKATLILLFAVPLAAQTGPKPVAMPKPGPAVKMFKPIPMQVWGIPDTAGLVIYETQPVKVDLGQKVKLIPALKIVKFTLDKPLESDTVYLSRK